MPKLHTKQYSKYTVCQTNEKDYETLLWCTVSLRQQRLTFAASSNFPNRSLSVSTSCWAERVVVRGVKLTMSANRMDTLLYFSIYSSLQLGILFVMYFAIKWGRNDILVNKKITQVERKETPKHKDILFNFAVFTK